MPEHVSIRGEWMLKDKYDDMQRLKAKEAEEAKVAKIAEEIVVKKKVKKESKPKTNSKGKPRK